ncbi:MAG: coenzyme F420-0:L-glutamate ligase [Candidatus Hadarchaeota archaeon]
MEIIGVKSPIIEEGDDLSKILLKSIEESTLKKNDILVVASSVVSLASGNTVKMKNVEPGKKAKKLSEKSGLNEKFVEIILQDADKTLGYSKKCIITLKDGMIKINAGADRSNVPTGKVVLLPRKPNKLAHKLKKEVQNKTGKEIGLVISDSHVNPLRRGTTGQSIGSNGLNAVLDCRNKKDLYGRELQMTFRNIADQIASAAQLIMGESNERVPFVIVRGVKDAFSKNRAESPKIPPEKCVYSSIIDYSGEKTEKEE